MGFPEVPEAGTIMDSLHVSPRLSNMLSPGVNPVNEFNLLIVFQGVAGFCACALVRESFPADIEK